jgi:hypothetical protein
MYSKRSLGEKVWISPDCFHPGSSGNLKSFASIRETNKKVIISKIKQMVLIIPLPFFFVAASKNAFIKLRFFRA